uniref:Uncharacterized protein n=1 Tax=Caenorhabditis japonica TaxID=281687 RepID=A0A8R1DUX9_CAEJA
MIFWFLVPPTFAAIWGLTAGNMFRPTPETDAEIGNSILEAYDIQMDSIVYIAAFASIPILLLHIPVSGLFIFPLLDRELGFFAGFVTITIALYPAIDPLPTIFVVENYRNAVFG